MKIFLVGLMLALIAVAANAETAYVTDKLSVTLRQTPADTGALLKALEAGTVLEVLERAGTMARVKDKQGTEGWIETRYLVAELPAREMLAKLQADLQKSKTQVKELEAQLKKSEEQLNEEAGKSKELSGKLASREQQLAAAVPPASVPKPVPAVEPAGPPGGLNPWVGALIGFAMLGVGFGVGVLWLKESIRKRSGGMYLRV